MAKLPERHDESTDQALDEVDDLFPFPDDTIAAIVATDPDVSVNELLRARSKGRRLLAIYRAGAAHAAARTPPSQQ